jgi:hypothetical protein
MEASSSRASCYKIPEQLMGLVGLNRKTAGLKVRFVTVSEVQVRWRKSLINASAARLTGIIHFQMEGSHHRTFTRPRGSLLKE